ncbi:xanthine dehydrogenase family protein subunit M [Sorangium sp. So ce375]|uniref:FAD binding domain-containing protein n=1 Tax=Sorangium sp. So ce375 TaxID=3133306 RepID=UPI003F5C7883
MKPFRYMEGESAEAATRAVTSAPGAVFFAGGTTLIDLMKIDVVSPDTLVDIRRLPLASITEDGEGVHIGANVRNSQLAWHATIRERYPVLSEAILSGASTQLRNMATTAGNILQRTRCPYFRDVHAACNKREPGSGCDAIDGFNRSHAVLGTTEHCIATYPSDMSAALVLLDAVVRTRKPDGTTRSIPLEDLHLLPGDTPERETVLEHGELITHVDLPHLSYARRSHYLKVRDRASYEFALASAAVALDMDGETIRAARVALGGVATKPWRCPEAERVLAGRRATADSFRAAADAALAGAVPRRHNGFKIELAQRALVRALSELTARAA